MCIFGDAQHAYSDCDHCNSLSDSLSGTAVNNTMLFWHRLYATAPAAAAAVVGSDTSSKASNARKENTVLLRPLFMKGLRET